MSGQIRLGVSQCLLGEPVRYDGQHKRDAFIVDTLGQYVDFVPVCPEVECGLPVPREAMRLVGTVEAPRLMTQRTGIDLTEQMLSWAAERVELLAGEGLCGFIFKAKSPSCGMEQVKVYNDHGGMAGRGVGLFARAFMTRFPLLPVEEEGRLNDPGLRENFIERIFTLKRYRDAMGDAPSLRALTQFHAAHKYLLMAHDPVAMRAMGRVLADAKGKELGEVVAWYEAELLKAMGKQATLCKQTDCLMHVLGYFKHQLSGDEKAEALTLIEQYKQGLVPLIVPMTLLAHYARKYQDAYLLQQAYLHPHPVELKLRNHA